MSLFRVRESVLCEGGGCVAKHMAGRSASSKAFARTQGEQSECSKKLVAANRAAQEAFGALCDEIAVVAKNGNGSCHRRG